MGKLAPAIQSEAAESASPGKHRLWSVAAELSLLVFCFVFAIYTAQAEPARRAVPQPASPAQQTKGPQDNVPPLTEPVPPSVNSGEAVAII
jgi:hypothetical protein